MDLLQQTDALFWIGIAAGCLICLLFIKESPEKDSKTTTCTVWFFRLLLSVLVPYALHESVKQLYPDANWLHAFGIITDSFIFLLLAHYVVRLIGILFWTPVQKKSELEIPVLIRGIIAVLVYLLACYGIVSVVLKKDITGLLVSTGIIAGILGLALQKILSDLFCGIAIALEKPFRIGDWIEIEGDRIGRVVDITWRSTRIRSWNSSIFVIPNSVAASACIHNYNTPDRKYANWYMVSVTADADPELVKRILLEACLSCQAVLKNPAPTVLLSDAAKRPYQYSLYVHFSDYLSHFRGKNEMFLSIHNYLSNAGIGVTSPEYQIISRDHTPVEITPPTTEELLCSLEIFSPFTDEEMTCVASESVLRSYSEGREIVSGKECDESLYIVCYGVVSIFKEPDQKNIPTILTSRIASGECFGEFSLLTGNANFDRAVAYTDCQIIEITSKSLKPILTKRPELTKELATILVQKIRFPENNIAFESIQDSSPRVNKIIHDFRSRIKRYFKISELQKSSSH
jgi:small-conductance mechanosensitive channel/CRP-like cAMP-binding protein